MKTVSVIGGYGIFGGRIAATLAKHPVATVRVVGRDAQAGERFAHAAGCEFRRADVEDPRSLRAALDGSHLVIHAAGPFQARDYRVAELCIERGMHYLDLADARSFVSGIGALDTRAKERGVFVSSGASSVPAITHALIMSFWADFEDIDFIQIALSPGNQNPRGTSTIQAILSYLGRPIRVWQDRTWIDRPGWDDRLELEFPLPVGRRNVFNCDVPDLELFPAAFNAATVRFSAGLELGFINTALYFLGSQHQRGRFHHLERRADLLRKLSLVLYPFGTKNGALAVWARGVGSDGTPIERRAAIVTDNDGPGTPSSPAIVIAKKILNTGLPSVGAFPCIGFLTLEEIMAELIPQGIWTVRGDATGWLPR